MNGRQLYPFTAIVGQDRMRLALLLHAVNPRLGGVLIRGERGTAKSTAVRALATLLPSTFAIDGCPFACDPTQQSHLCDQCSDQVSDGLLPRTIERLVPVVDLPIGATEDRVLGSLDLEHAIQSGERKFEPGLLARANGGILYVDEVNLLADHLVDILLDAAALGWNYIEREGISFKHPASFMLVGTMNPEEGELRPQLLDRFALTIDVTGLEDTRDRAEVIRRRIAFEEDPVGFIGKQGAAEDAERRRLTAARALLPSVVVPANALDLIVRICAAFAVDGMRGDLAMYRTATALAAYDGRITVEPHDIRLAAELTLPHRRKREPFDGTPLDMERLDEAINEDPAPEPAAMDGREMDHFAGGKRPPEPQPRPTAPSGGGGQRSSVSTSNMPNEYQPKPSGSPTSATGSVAESGAPMNLSLPKHPSRQTSASRSRRSGYAQSAIGAAAGTVRSGDRSLELAAVATLRAAAPYQAARGATPNLAIKVLPQDVHRRLRRAHASELVLFVVDASGSMSAGRRMQYAKSASLGLLRDAHRRRDRVAMVAFQNDRAELVLPPTNNVDIAERRLRFLPSGGRTPLASGLELARATIDRTLQKHQAVTPVIVLVSDGKANVGLGGHGPWKSAITQAKAIRQRSWPCLVVDVDNRGGATGLARALATELNGRLLSFGAGKGPVE
jgi:magnesium chelatase subunit D